MRIQARILAADLDTLPRTKLEDCAEDLHGCADVLFVYDGEIDDFLREVDCEAVVHEEYVRAPMQVLCAVLELGP
ncbi:MAG: hypothetical protein AAFU79_20865, partial [Myxococcota bacterium]